MQVNGAFHGIQKTRVIEVYNISVYGIDFFSDQANEAMILKKKVRMEIIVAGKKLQLILIYHEIN